MSVNSDLHKALAARFGEHRVSEIPVLEGEMPLLMLDLELKSPVTIIMTNGLRSYIMPVPEKWHDYEHVELYFCLPSYWEWDAINNPQMNWIYPWIQRLSNHVIQKKTWFGHGHTMPCGAEMKPLSATMKQDHFFLSLPILLEEELKPIVLEDKTVNFLAIIPIFKNELDYKHQKGTLKFLQKMKGSGVSEKLDDYRTSITRGRWRFFPK